MLTNGFSRHSVGNLWQRLVQGGRRVWQRADWPVFAGPDWEDRAMSMDAADDFHAKQGRSTCRVILQADDRQRGVYLKRGYCLPWWRGWLATLFPKWGWSPAWQEWRNLRWAHSQGVPVPEPLAVAEFIGPWGKLQGFLAIEELAGMVRLHEAVPLAVAKMDPGMFQTWKRGLILELARLTRLLHDRCRFHKDLYLSHFFIPRSAVGPVADWHGQVYLIDFHRLRYHPLTWPLWQAKDLGQLLFSSQVPGITGRDRLRFWHCYLRMNSRDRWLRRLVLFKNWTYQRHRMRKQRRAAG
jgi:Lipopolysaccharide kinase (Kdo/WaaP) family